MEDLLVRPSFQTSPISGAVIAILIDVVQRRCNRAVLKQCGFILT